MLTSGALPIQTPVSPNGKLVVTANTLSGTISIIDTEHRYTGQDPDLQRGMSRRELWRKEGRRVLRLRLEQVLERPDHRRSRSGQQWESSDAEIVGRVVLVADAGTTVKTTLR